jgi:hypothetical protein
VVVREQPSLRLDAFVAHHGESDISRRAGAERVDMASWAVTAIDQQPCGGLTFRWMML